jgi:spermidine synthase
MRIFPYLAFFGSGLAALTAEVALHRALVAIAGDSANAASTSAALVLIGLSAGAAIGGPLAARRREEGLRLFAGVVLAAAGFTAMAPLSVLVLGRFYSTIAPSLSAPFVSESVRTVFAALLLVPPALTWGAAFPLITAGAGGRDDGPRRRSRSAGWLFSANMLGASLGALAAGAWLLPAAGVRATLFLSAGVGVAAALTALFWDSLGPVLRGEPRRRWRPRPSPDELAEAGLAESSGLSRFSGLSVFVVGFAAFGFQALALRLVMLFFGNGLLVYSTATAAALLAAGAGAAVGSSWSTKAFPPPDRLASALSGALAVSGLAVFLLPHVFQAVAVWAGAGALAGRPFWVFVLLLAPLFALGGCFPLAVRLRTSCGLRASEAAGSLYAAHGIGGVVGAACVIWFLISVAGMRGALCWVAAACVAAAGAGWRLSRGRTYAWRWRVCAVAAAAAAAAPLIGDPGLTGVYRRGLAASEPATVVRHEETRRGTDTVLEFGDFTARFSNGVETASTRFFHVQGAKLFGMLGPLLHEDASSKPALMLDFGSGIAAGAALHSGLVSALDVVENGGANSTGVAAFDKIGGNPAEHPGFRPHDSDARRFLIASRSRWPLIAAGPAESAAGEGWALRTLEFYRLIRSRLQASGVFVQWIETEGVPEPAFRARVKTFLEVFPHASLWNVPGSGLSVLAATPAPLVLDRAAIQERLDRASAEADNARFGLDRAEALASLFVAEGSALAVYAGKIDPATDDRPGIVLSGLRTPGLPFSQLQKNAFEDERRFALSRALRRYYAYGDLAALAEAYAIDPDDGNAVYHSRAVAGVDYERRFPEKTGWIADLEADAENPGSFAERARLLFEIGDTGAAFRVLEEARGKWPDNARWSSLAAAIAGGRRRQDAATRQALLARLSAFGTSAAAHESEGFIRFVQREYEVAGQALERALALNPESTTALVNLADLKAREGLRNETAKILKRALAVNPFCESALLRMAGIADVEGTSARARWLRRRIPSTSDRPPFYPCGEYCRPWTESWAASGRP